jgi:hypothetical protein
MVFAFGLADASAVYADVLGPEAFTAASVAAVVATDFAVALRLTALAAIANAAFTLTAGSATAIIATNFAPAIGFADALLCFAIEAFGAGAALAAAAIITTFNSAAIGLADADPGVARILRAGALTAASIAAVAATRLARTIGLAEAAIEGMLVAGVGAFSAAIVGVVDGVPAASLPGGRAGEGLEQIVIAPVKGVAVAAAGRSDTVAIATAEASPLGAACSGGTFATTTAAAIAAALPVQAVGDALLVTCYL